MAAWHDIFSPIPRELIPEEAKREQINRLIGWMVALVSLVLVISEFFTLSASMENGVDYSLYVLLLSIAKVSLYLVGYIAVCFGIRSVSSQIASMRKKTEPSPKDSIFEATEEPTPNHTGIADSKAKEEVILPIEKILKPGDNISVGDIVVKTCIFLKEYNDGKALACLLAFFQDKGFVETDNLTVFFDAIKSSFPDDISINIRAFQTAYNNLEEKTFSQKIQEKVDKMYNYLEDILKESGPK